jgi:hypothetical protein
MTLQEIFDQLSTGELSQTNLGTLTEDKYPRAIMHINLGLADLFKRFFLREGRLTIELDGLRSSYPLDMKYAAANKRSKVTLEDRFIADSTSAPFVNDVLKVEKVIASTGYEFILNDTGLPYSILATDTAPFTLQVPAKILAQASDLPEELITDTLEVVYRARHPKIDTEVDPESYEVRLPDSHLQALLYYVASRVQAPMGMGGAEGVTSMNFAKRYEEECALLAGAGLALERNASFDKLRDRGFA